MGEIKKVATAHVLINCVSGSKEAVINELKKFDSVREVEKVYGTYDIIAKLESPNTQELKDNIGEDIRKIKKIISTITLMNVDGY